MANPFEVGSGDFLVLGNDEGRFSLWPGFTDVPPGWSVAAGPDARAGVPGLHRADPVTGF
ncbi:MbtH family NRPS accessory protein [Micromonospora sp. NPDC020750]|uniref:MbtH family NRPS accessory protein n=1 Tax=unclassified Micromonospora TaxID=2617518 RepID=UPI0037877957